MSLTKVKINLGTEGNLSGSRSIVQSTKTLVSGSAQISSDISGSFNAASSSFSTRVATIEGSGTAQGVGTSDSPTFNNLTATGTVTAQEFHSEFVSASIAFTSGSHILGNSSDDIQQMTGSLRVSGSTANESYIIGSNVGIGTDNPAQTLHIQGASNTGGIRLGNTGYSYYNEVKNNGDGLLIDVDKGDAGGSGADLRINISDTERLRITNDGELGINSNNPDEELEVFGATDVGIKLRALGTTTTAGSHVPTISLQSNQGDGVTARASISADRDGASTKGALIFSSRVSDNITEVMRINGSGNVGIGTNNPTFHNGGGLHISNATAARLHLTDSDAGEGTLDGMYVAQIGTEAFVYNFENDALIFGTNTSERMRILAGGNVGIGTTAPADLLEVNNGNFKVSGSNQRIFVREDGGQNSVELGHSTSATYDGFLALTDDSGTTQTLLRSGTGKSYINNGNVGIGITDPQDLLHVADGSVRVGTDSGDYGQFYYSGGGMILRNQWANDNAYVRIATANDTTGVNVMGTGKVGIGTTSPGASIHIYANEPTLWLEDANHANDTYAGLNANSAAGSLEVGADVLNQKHGSYVSIQVDGAEKLQVSGSGELLGRHGAPVRLSGNWQVVDVVSLSSASSYMQSSIAFEDNTFSHFKIVIPYINVVQDGADLLFSFLYNDGSGLTEDASYYYGHKTMLGHSSSAYAGGAYDNQSRMTIADNVWADDSGGIYGQIDVYNVTTGDTRNFPSKFFGHDYSGDGDRGSNFRPFAKFEIMGYDSGGGTGYGLQMGAFRNNNDRHASYWKGFRIQANTNNLVAGSKMIISGMVL